MIDFRQKIIDACFPEGITCNVCGGELTDRDDRDIGLCPNCFGHLRRTDRPKSMLRENTVYALYRYDSVRDIILDAKDHNKPHLTTMMGRLMARAYLEMDLSADVVFYVPAGKKNVRRRGYDHMRYVAEEFSKRLDLPLCHDLKCIKESADQTQVSPKERYENVRDSFRYEGEKLYGKKVVLLDDVVTTGATLSACLRELRLSCADQIFCLVLGKAGE